MIYDNLSKDPNSLSNLDQDLPNYAQHQVTPIWDFQVQSAVVRSPICCAKYLLA